MKKENHYCAPCKATTYHAPKRDVLVCLRCETSKIVNGQGTAAERMPQRRGGAQKH